MTSCGILTSSLSMLFLGPSMLLHVALFHPCLWPGSIPLHLCMPYLYPFRCRWILRLFSHLGFLWPLDSAQLRAENDRFQFSRQAGNVGSRALLCWCCCKEKAWLGSVYRRDVGLEQGFGIRRALPRAGPGGPLNVKDVESVRPQHCDPA